jgi:hypothetical protein
VETNTDLGNPAWVAVQSHNSTAPPVTSVFTTGGTAVTITTRPTSTTSTRTASAAKNFVGASFVGAIAMVGMGLLL